MTTTPPKKTAKKATPKPPAKVAKTPAKKGRRTSLNPEVQERIVEALKSGCYVEEAVTYVGISVATVYNWMDRGRKERNRLQAFPDSEPDTTEVVFLEFLEAVEKARAASQIRAIAQIQKAASDGTWQAAAWYLERSAPKRWGRRAEVEVTGSEGGPIRMDVDVTELEKKIAHIIEKRGLEE